MSKQSGKEERYVVESIVGGDYTFLAQPDEDNHLVIAVEEVVGECTEGDIVMIVETDGKYIITVVQGETVQRRKNVEGLLAKLQNK